MIIEGTAVVVEGDNIDTDVLYPGSFLNIDDPDAMKPYLFEGLDPSIRDRLEPSCVLVVGDNFGSGSSREHVPLAMKAWGVGCVLGHSFARIFHRNCINLGLPVVTSPEAAAAASGEVTTGSPRLMQLRWKMRAKLWPKTQPTPHAFIARGTCSRDDPDPKLSPTTSTQEGSRRSRIEGSRPSNK